MPEKYMWWNGMRTLLFVIAACLLASCSKSVEIGRQNCTHIATIPTVNKGPARAYGEAIKAKIIGQDTVMRSLQSTTAESCMQLEYGDTVNIVERGQIETIDGNTCYWYKVLINGKSGWVYGRDILINGSLLEKVFGRWRHYHGLKDMKTIIWPTIDIREDGRVEFYYDLMQNRVFIHDVNKLQYYLTTEYLHDKFFHLSIIPLLKNLKWKYNAVDEVLLVELPSMPERPETMGLFSFQDVIRANGESMKNGIDIDYKNKIITLYLQEMFFDASMVFVNGGIEKRFHINGWTYNKER